MKPGTVVRVKTKEDTRVRDANSGPRFGTVVDNNNGEIAVLLSDGLMFFGREEQVEVQDEQGI